MDRYKNDYKDRRRIRDFALELLGHHCDAGIVIATIQAMQAFAEAGVPRFTPPESTIEQVEWYTSIRRAVLRAMGHAKDSVDAMEKGDRAAERAVRLIDRATRQIDKLAAAGCPKAAPRPAWSVN